MNRNVSALLFFAAATFIAGCSGGSSSAGMGSPVSTTPTGPASVDTDLEAFARAGMTDPEYVESREVNELNLVSNENPDAFADWF